MIDNKWVDVKRHDSDAHAAGPVLNSEGLKAHKKEEKEKEDKRSKKRKTMKKKVRFVKRRNKSYAKWCNAFGFGFWVTLRLPCCEMIAKTSLDETTRKTRAIEIEIARESTRFAKNFHFLTLLGNNSYSALRQRPMGKVTTERHDPARYRNVLTYPQISTIHLLAASCQTVRLLSLCLRSPWRTWWDRRLNVKPFVGCLGCSNHIQSSIIIYNSL